MVEYTYPVLDTKLYTEISSCRACGSDHIESVLDLGNLCISDFTSSMQLEDRAPLELISCQECSLIQLRHTVDRDRLYKDYYYRSGLNESMVAALQDIADDTAHRVDLSTPSYIVDIGSNDGTLLSLYPKKHVRYGFEPSRNVIQLEPYNKSDLSGVKVYPIYFPPTWKPACKAMIITSIAMFYDVDDPNSFVSAIKNWLHPNGIWVLQMPDLRQMLDLNAFDNICHEHLTYWPIHALIRLLDTHGLMITAISRNQVNGGSTRYIITHGQHERIPSHARWFWNHHIIVFRENMEHLRCETITLLRKLKADGKRVYGYGASTKGNTLLQYYGITSELLPFITDRNPDKWGKLTVGSHIPIISEDSMRVCKPDYLFVLPWGFIDTFKQREAEFLERGGQFIVPLPKLDIIGG